MPRRGRMRAPSRSASSPAGAPRGSPTQTLECLLAQKTGAELLRTSFTVLIETALFWENLSRPASRWRPWPPSVRPPQKSSAFLGSPTFSILRRAEPAFRQENFRLLAENFAWTRRSARLAYARKRGRSWTAFSRPASQSRLSPPSARPLFCCGPCRSPQEFRSGPPPRKSAYRGRGPPRR